MTRPERPHALVTGGGSGIGLAVARALAEGGARLSLVGRDAAKIASAAKAIGDACPISADVTDEAAIHAAFEAARATHGPIDILISNAGAAPSAPFRDTDLTLWNATLAVNLTGAFLCARAALPHMLQSKWGRIVNVASVAGLKGYAYVSAYCAAKHGLVGLTRALAQETAKHGVTVNAVCPGYVETEIVTESIARLTRKTTLDETTARASLVAFNPQGRMISAREVAAMIAWLCGEDAAAINGAAIPITGGEI